MAKCWMSLLPKQFLQRVTLILTSGGLWSAPQYPYFAQLKSASLRGEQQRVCLFFIYFFFNLLLFISWFAFRSHMISAEGFFAVRMYMKSTRRKNFVALCLDKCEEKLDLPHDICSLQTTTFKSTVLLQTVLIHKFIMQIKEFLHNSFQPGHKDTLCYMWFPGARGQQRKKKQ